MKKTLKIVGLGIGAILVVLIVIVLYAIAGNAWRNHLAKRKMTIPAPVLAVGDFEFRDLNKNSELDPYEDWRVAVDLRVENLLAQMTLEEKAGLMVYPFVGTGENGEINNSGFSFPMLSTLDAIFNRKIAHFASMSDHSPEIMAKWHNDIQKLAERTRLGIPISVSSDPRHSARAVGASVRTRSFSQWPDQIGLGAIGDSSAVVQFGRIAAQEYRAIGIHTALHPMTDLSTEPRWARTVGTFGEDAELAAKLTAAYVYGFQGDTLGPNSVSCMTKHFPGGGPQKDGWDAHFKYGMEQVYPGNNFEYHLIPFKAAIKAGTAQLMPYYGIPMDQTSENVGFSFNKEIITDLLRNRMGFEGIVCTDWLIMLPFKLFGYEIVDAKDHGVENLSVMEKFKKALEAGVDQFGGERYPKHIVKLARKGEIDEARIDASIRRLLKLKFQLGLFDHPYVDVDKARDIAGNPDFVRAGELAQRKAIVLLKNMNTETGKILPLKVDTRVYIENIEKAAASKYGIVVDRPDDADVAILRLNAPYEPRKGLLESIFHQGSLEYPTGELDSLLQIMNSIPTVVSIYMDRPAVIPEIAAASAGLFADFGASDEAVLDVIFGRFQPQGKLPFEIPSSMEAVRNQKEDVPYDTENPLFSFGFGLSY